MLSLSSHRGVVRRVDRLGRVVIPKEYRKLHKIKISDPLEITTYENGDIILRKFDMSALLIESGQPIVDELSAATDLAVVLTDCDRVVLATALDVFSATNTRLSEKTSRFIQERKVFKGDAGELELEINSYKNISMQPVFVQDTFGSLMLLSNDNIEEWQDKVLIMAAKLLAKTMQKF